MDTEPIQGPEPIKAPEPPANDMAGPSITFRRLDPETRYQLYHGEEQVGGFLSHPTFPDKRLTLDSSLDGRVVQLHHEHLGLIWAGVAEEGLSADMHGPQTKARIAGLTRELED